MATNFLSIFSILLFFHFSNSLPFLLRKADTSRTNANVVTLEQNARVPECIHDIEPKFRLLTRNSEPIRNSEKSINQSTRNSEPIRKLSHLVILIHGFNSRPSVWADDMAQSILEGDREKKSIGVMVVDWEKGAR